MLMPMVIFAKAPLDCALKAKRVGRLDLRLLMIIMRSEMFVHM